MSRTAVAMIVICSFMAAIFTVSLVNPIDAQDSQVQAAQAQTADKGEKQRKSEEYRAKVDAEAFALIEQWKKEPVIPMRSKEFPKIIANLEDKGRIGLPQDAQPIDVKDLDKAIREDLDRAIIDFLQAYETGFPENAFKYMTERNLVLSNKWREALRTKLGKNKVLDIFEMDDGELFKSAWTLDRPYSHWEALVAKASCRQVWNGKQTPLKKITGIHVVLSEDLDPEKMDQPSRLMRLFHGSASYMTYFTARQGSIEEAHAKQDELLLCDLQAVIEEDESQSDFRSAWFFRFWYNKASKKWQPIIFLTVDPDPAGSRSYHPMMF